MALPLDALSREANFAKSWFLCVRRPRLGGGGRPPQAEPGTRRAAAKCCRRLRGEWTRLDGRGDNGTDGNFRRGLREAEAGSDD